MTENQGYFINLDLSRAMLEINLTKNKDLFPYNPLQLSKKRLRNQFLLSLDHKTKSYTKIAFMPKNRCSNCFSGTITISSDDYAVLEVTLHNTENKGAVFKGIGGAKIEHIDYWIKYSYYKNDSMTILNNIILSYIANIGNLKGSKYIIKTEGFIHLYDYSNPFISPYFDCQELVEDYRLFSIPPDTLIWSELVRQNRVKLTPDQIEKRNDLKAKGHNFKAIFSQENSLFESNYQHWSKDYRLLIRTTKPTVTKGEIRKVEDLFTSPLLIDQLNIKTLLYFDFITKGDGYIVETSAILDVYNSFNYLQNTPELLAYVNIYFDIAEIHRRKLEKSLNEGIKSKDEMENIYYDTVRRMELEQKELREAAFAGKNLKELAKWNKLVADELEIDNMKLFKLPN